MLYMKLNSHMPKMSIFQILCHCYEGKYVTKNQQITILKQKLKIIYHTTLVFSYLGPISQLQHHSSLKAVVSLHGHRGDFTAKSLLS